MKINFVTSFNEEIYTVVGHHLINSIKNNWEPSIKVTGYYHDFNVKNYIIKDINLKSLNKLEDYTTFLKVKLVACIESFHFHFQGFG